MKLLSHILIPLAGTAMLTSCLSSVKPDGGHGVITFEPVVGAEVRAVTLSAFPENMSLGVWAVTEDGQTYIDREEVSFNGESWTTASSREWPEGTALRFYGFAPYEHQMKMETGGRMVIEDYDLSVKEDAQGLYIAEPTGMLTGDKGAVHMAFRLASAKIDFRIDNGLNQVTNVKLEKIILSGVYCKGSFDSSADPQWTVSGEPSDLVAFDSSVDGKTVDVGRDPVFVGDTLEIIPQQSHPRVKVVYSFQSADSHWLTGQENWTDELKAEWEPGRHYTYTLTLTEGIVKHSPGISSGAE